MKVFTLNSLVDVIIKFRPVKGTDLTLVQNISGSHCGVSKGNWPFDVAPCNPIDISRRLKDWHRHLLFARWKKQVPAKLRYFSFGLHDVTSKKTPLCRKSK